MSTNKRPPSKRIPDCEETGMLTGRADLPNPKPGAEEQKETQTLMPHERDQTTRPTGTSHRGDKHSREVIGQAHKDTKRGLQDTDRRGIPSDIVDTDVPAADDLPGVPSSENTKKR
jgi:hypothetical protein